MLLLLSRMAGHEKGRYAIDISEHIDDLPNHDSPLRIVFTGAKRGWLGGKRNGQGIMVGIDFIDDKNGWMMVDYGAACGSDGVGIYSTMDGGVTWTPVSSATPDQQDSPGALPFGGDKDGICFADRQHGWVTGQQNGQGLFLYMTGDGGKTWHQQDLNVPEGLHAEGGSAQTHPPVFYGAGGVLPVVFGGDGPSMVFYKSDDRGLTWRRTAPVKLTSPYSQMLWSIPDLQHFYVSDGSRIYASGDGGQTWKTISLDLKSGQIRQLDFISGGVGWILGDSFIMQTRDGGTSWTGLNVKLSGS